MASFTACIDQAFKAGRITKDVAERLKSAEDVDGEITNIVATLSRQRRETAIAATRLATGWEQASGHQKGAYEGLLSMLSKDRTGTAGYANVEYRQHYHKGRYHSKVADMLQRFRTRRLGWYQNQDDLNMMVKAIYGETVPDADIMRFAKQWHELTEQMRQDFNKAGGSIGKNERYLMPQNHDARAILKVGKDKWKAFIKPKLDVSQMLDDAGRAMGPEELDKALDYVYDTITTHGLNKAQDLSVPRLGKKLARKHSEKRFLFFKDAESWMAYQKDFGRGDIFTTLTSHIDSMASDIGLMEILGPSPESTFKAMLSQLEKSGEAAQLEGWMRKGIYAALPGKAEEWRKASLQAIYNNVAGKTNSGELTGFADFMQSTRNIITASTLGKAFLSAFSDIGFQALTATYNNVSPFKVLARHMKTMTNEQAQVFAVRMGLTAEAMIGRLHAANRYADAYGTGPTAKVAESVMRGSLLAPWTDAGRKAFGMEFGAMLADNFGKTIDELDANVRRAFESYGIKADDWDTFRATAPLEYDGGKFADLTQPGGVKFHQMIMSETDYAVPTPDAKVRAFTNRGLGRATLEGQVWRAGMMLKSFPATIIMTHFYRAAYQSSTAGRLKYLGAMMATTTVLGGMSLQLKDIAAGRDPRPMDNTKFLAAAVQQGGGFGLMGDFVFSDQNRFGGGVMDTFRGPMFELADKSFDLTAGNILQAIRGEETNILGESVKFLNRYTPDVWQTTLLANAMFDQLEILADPDAEKKFHRLMRKRGKEYDQGFWWRQGEIAPRRAPDFSNAKGD